MNWCGMTTDGNQIVNSQVSSTPQRKQCQVWMKSWYSEEAAKIGFVKSPPLVESVTDWRDRIKQFGFGNEKRKQGDEHSLCGLSGAFATRINVIIVTTSGYHTEQYNPPINRTTSEEIWLIYLCLEHTRHYLSTTKVLNNTPGTPPSTTGGANGPLTRTRRVIGSTKPINDPTPAVVSSARIPDPIPLV